MCCVVPGINIEIYLRNIIKVLLNWHILTLYMYTIHIYKNYNLYQFYTCVVSKLLYMVFWNVRIVLLLYSIIFGIYVFETLA